MKKQPLRFVEPNEGAMIRTSIISTEATTVLKWWKVLRYSNSWNRKLRYDPLTAAIFLADNNDEENIEVPGRWHNIACPKIGGMEPPSVPLMRPTNSICFRKG